jgi:hypothetical protein
MTVVMRSRFLELCQLYSILLPIDKAVFLPCWYMRRSVFQKLLVTGFLKSKNFLAGYVIGFCKICVPTHLYNYPIMDICMIV